MYPLTPPISVFRCPGLNRGAAVLSSPVPTSCFLLPCFLASSAPPFRAALFLTSRVCAPDVPAIRTLRRVSHFIPGAFVLVVITLGTIRVALPVPLPCAAVLLLLLGSNPLPDASDS